MTAAILYDRAILKDVFKQRIPVEGRLVRYEKMGPKRVGLTSDVEVTIDGKTHYIGHVYLQGVDSLEEAGVQPGDRFACTCWVDDYSRRIPDEGPTAVRRDYNLNQPADITILDSPSAPDDEEPEPTPAPPPPPVQAAPLPEQQQGDILTTIPAIKAVKTLAARVGGLDRLADMIEALRN